MVTYTNYSNELAGRVPEVVEKGRREASAHRPPTDATHMDQHEAAIVTDADRWLASEHRLFSAVLTDTSKSAADIQQKALELEGRIEQVLADSSLHSAVAAEMADDRPSFVQVVETRLRAQVDWKHFRANNEIREEAVYPDSRIWHFGLVAACALVETLVNSFFYENAQGLLGGFIVALAVSAINLSGAMALGYGFRYKNVIDRTKKLLGWLCAVLFVLLSIYCNALFAAFRSEYQLLSDPTDVGQVRVAFTRATEAAGRAFSLNMHFGDLMSFILFGFGILLSIFAFYKGYTVDDRYPGHGEKDRAMKAAKAVELQKQDEIRERVKEVLNGRRHEIQALIHEPAQLISGAGARIADVQRGHTTFATQRSAIKRDLSLLLKSYRDANTAIRATAPPSYFAAIPDLDVPTEADAMNEVLALLRGVQEKVRELRDKYQDALNAKLNALQNDSARILNETFAQFVRDVEHDAEELINRQTITVAAVT